MKSTAYNIMLRHRSPSILFIIVLLIVGSGYAIAYPLQKELKDTYQAEQSSVITDRYGKEIVLYPNEKGYYERSLDYVPRRFKQLLLAKEDRFFYWHPGINPLSVIRELLTFTITRQFNGSSTLTQQLVKILLRHEKQRTVSNKIKEAIFALALERYTPKEEILTMYLNSAYFGNKVEGLAQASKFYFNARPESLNDSQMLSLLATLNNPSHSYPGTPNNQKRSRLLAHALGLAHVSLVQPAPRHTPSKTAFELGTLHLPCHGDCQLTIDEDLTQTLRDILQRNLSSPFFAGVNNGAIVVIKLPENELLSIVGSPDPLRTDKGLQINTALKPRPIGSTAKPFIYLQAFKKGARPYTLVDDREYKYRIGTGFSFYPKNYDGKFRGTVTLHQALSNSLNVPTVKVLEYAGLDRIYSFLEHELSFIPVRPLESYQLGIALGGLEMDLLTLAHYFTLFPEQGILTSLRITTQGSFLSAPMQRDAFFDKQVMDRGLVQLVNKILSDRETSIDQFGMKSNLNLSQSNYALKTGTSRDFHDSWTIGYTPDFLVGVWIGNADNTPMWQLSGQSGAGKIWHEVMEVMINSSYNKKTPFDFSQVKEFTQSGSIEYGLARDDYQKARLIMQEHHLVISPHDGDVFLFQPGMTIPLKAASEVSWYINDAFIDKSKQLLWKPQKRGQYKITTRDLSGNAEMIMISIGEEQ